MRIQLRFLASLIAFVTIGASFSMLSTSSVYGFAPQAEKEEPKEPQPPSLEDEIKKIDEQIAEVKEDLAKKPNDTESLKLMAVMLGAKAQLLIENKKNDEGYGAYEESGKLWRLVKKGSKELDDEDTAQYATAIYNLACALSLRKEIAPAIEALKESIDGGFENFSTLKKDADLDPLRNESEFKKLLEAIVKLQVERAKKDVSAKPLFDFDFKLPDLNGKDVSLSDFADKIVIVDVWGTWCPPCRMEIPHFVELHKKYASKGVEIVGLNYENEEDADEVKKLVSKFVKRFEIPYACLIGDEATQEKIPDFEGFPTTLFVDRKGKVRAKIVGYHEMVHLEAMLEVLLNESADSQK